MSPATFAWLLTTGPSAKEDCVVEAAAVRFDGSQILDQFEGMADPGELPPAVSDMTGLRPGDLSGKPTPARLLKRLLKFCGDEPLVTHDAERFRSFVEAAGVRCPACVDARDLARIVRPTAADYTLAGLAQDLELGGPAGPRAAEKAHLTAKLWLGLLDGLRQIEPAALNAVCRLAEAAGEHLAPALSEAAAAGGEFELSSDPRAALRKLFEDHAELFQRAQDLEEDEPGEEPISTDGICEMFRPDGPIGRNLPGYEQRPQQVRMVREVCDALNGPNHLMVEAGTGTGKSMAYLLPAVAWSCTNGDKIVVSTNTRNLQEQLYRKDLPFLSGLLPGRFEPALLKGRRNYLCVRRFLHLMRHFERELAEPQEFMALAPLLTWVGDTESGDLAECNGFLFAEASGSVMSMVTAGSEECAGRACRYRRRCFVRRARALAQLADLIVVNHALLFAELGLDTPVLPPYRCLVFDEAQNIEDVATEALATTVDGFGIFRITRLLYRQRRDGSGSGLLATVMHEAEEELPESGSDRVAEECGRTMEAVQEVVEAAKQFFEMLEEPFRELPPYADRIMLRECEPPVGPGTEAWDAAERLRTTIADLGEKVEATAQELDAAGRSLEAAAEMAEDLRSQVARLREFSEAVQFVLSQQEEDFVYWLEKTTRQHRSFYSAHAAPVKVGDQIRNFFLREKRCVVFTSATLQVDGDFSYMLERLGAETLPSGHIQCLSVGSPFDYDRQAMLGVTTFLPDPGGRRDRTYDTELASFLTDLLRSTRGRALVLFTSYSLLEAVYESVKDPLERSGIMVLAQGHGGSRDAITSLFRNNTSSVLLGTRSFWEGVDISGETLSCLVLTKLPFHVFTDPLVRGRTEYLQRLGKDPFSHYTLPEAVINFRQGSGRLIRRSTDTGVLICTDRRLVTKAYGSCFLNSMPTRAEVFRSPEEAIEAVEDFFQRTGADFAASPPAGG